MIYNIYQWGIIFCCFSSRNYTGLGIHKRFLGLNVGGDKPAFDQTHNALVKRPGGKGNKEVDRETEHLNDEGKEKISYFHGNFGKKAIERRGKLLGHLSEVESHMLSETSPKPDKYDSQRYWKGFNEMGSRFCQNASKCDLWKETPGRKVQGFHRYTRFRSLTKRQSEALNTKLCSMAKQIEKDKRIRSYYINKKKSNCNK